MTRTPTTPYGTLVTTRVRVVTWNLWWRLGDWEPRAEAIALTLEELRPDLVCLQEVLAPWRDVKLARDWGESR
jgi:endonuclease/exonuclease/phosphatase family metal-dependent hydrolase